MYIGGFTNFFSKVVITGLVLYIVHPNNFNSERFNPLYDRIKEKIYPVISKVYYIEDSMIQIEDVSNNMNGETNIQNIQTKLPPIKLNIVSK